MNFLNEHEIDTAVNNLRKTHAGRYAAFLSDYKDAVNANSDGWPYWTPAVRAADKLITLINAATSSVRDLSPAKMPSESQFKASLSPIKSFATRHKLPQPTLPEPLSSPPEEDAEYPSPSFR